MSLPKPYYAAGGITLYHGNALELAPLVVCDAVVTDSPYGSTSLKWDRWPIDWPAAAPSSQLWCYGSLRMFMDHCGEFLAGQWKLAQDVVWEKHNGSNNANDRFRRVHEQAAHFYRGRWEDQYVAPPRTLDASARVIRRKERPPHWGEVADSTYVSEDGGPLIMRSVIHQRSEHGRAVHATQKPIAVMRPLIEHSVPLGGTVLDMFCGSGSTLLAAMQCGRLAIGIDADEKSCEKAARRCGQELPLYLP